MSNEPTKLKYALYYTTLRNGAKLYNYMRWRNFIAYQIGSLGSLNLVNTYLCEESVIKEEVRSLNEQNDNLFNTDEDFTPKSGKPIYRKRKSKSDDTQN